MKTLKQIEEMKAEITAKYSKQITEITRIVKGNRLIVDRQDALIKLGYNVGERPMGSGGVGQMKKINNEVRIQIGYGHAKHNYAMCVIFK